MNKLYLGIDTSNYTTSMAVVDSLGNVIEDRRKSLFVKGGMVGLRQQEAFFQHIKNLPVLFECLQTDLGLIEAIGVSTRPRNAPGSYMPVFLAGTNFGRVIAKSLNIPIKGFSHQEGHIACCILGEDADEDFLSLHLSGGTTEVVHSRNRPDNLYTDTVGGTLDISMGQLIDRLGVHMGMDFPAGRELDLVAQRGKKLDLKIPKAIKDGWVNLSGLENTFKRMIDDSSLDKGDVIYTLFSHLGEIIRELVLYHRENHGVKKVYLAGGVSANSIIRKSLAGSLGEVDLVFPEAALSVDNAVGIGYLTGIKAGWEVVHETTTGK